MKDIYATLCLIVVVVAPGAAPAAADDIDGKLCILASAQKLPPVPGIVITSSSAKDLDANDAAEKIATKNQYKGSALIAEVFGFLDYKTEQEIKNSYSSNYRLLLPGIKSNMSRAMTVEIDVQAAAQRFTFSFVCALITGGGYYSQPLGVSK